MLEEYAKEKQEEFEFYRQILLEKMENGELDVPTLQRLIDQIFWTGHYVGHCRGESYMRRTYEIE